MRLSLSLATVITPDRRGVVEQHCVTSRPFRTPSPNGVDAQPSNVDRGSQGLSFQPLDDPTGQQLAAREAGRRHGYGEGCIQTH